jgi:hypothetical protein
MTAQIHTLLVIALLVPFVAVALSLIGLIFVMCWKGPR